MKEVKPQHEYAPNNKKALPPPAETRTPRTVGSAKLVIIMDDVSYAHDVKA